MKRIKQLLFILFLSVTMSVCKPGLLSANDYLMATPAALTPLSEPTKTPVTTEPDPRTTIDAPQAVMVTQTTTAIPSNTPTPEPTIVVNPYLFDSYFGVMDLSYGPIDITFDEGVLKGVKISASLISPINLGDFNSTSEGLQLGNGVAVIRDEKYGNLLITMHSGFFHNNPLEAEKLRYFLEGWGKNNPDFVLENIYRMIGSKGTISTDTGNLEIEVSGVVRLQHEETKDIGNNPTNVLDIATLKDGKGNYIALGNAEVFENIKKNGHEIMLNFCGWNQNQTEDTYYTYYRYVILLNVREESGTPENIK